MQSIKERFYYNCRGILSNIPPQKLKAMSSEAKSINLSKNKILFKEGTYPDGVYFLTKGKIKIYQLNPSGKFQIVYIYTAGEYFGFRPLLNDGKHPVSAETLEETKLLFYPKDSFFDLLNTSPVLMKNLLAALSYEFNIWVNLMTAFSHKAVKERVALALLILQEKYRKSEDEKVTAINLGREDLASFSNTTTETCVRVLTQFKEEGIIKTDGRKIRILNVEELLNIADLH